MADYQFYRIMGRITDSNAQPMESVSVRLRRAGETHETEVLSADRTSLRGEFFFELSLLEGSQLRIEIEDPHSCRIIDYRDFKAGAIDDITINFVI